LYAGRASLTGAGTGGGGATGSIARDSFETAKGGSEALSSKGDGVSETGVIGSGAVRCGSGSGSGGRVFRAGFGRWGFGWTGRGFAFFGGSGFGTGGGGSGLRSAGAGGTGSGSGGAGGSRYDRSTVKCRGRRISGFNGDAMFGLE